MTVQHLVLIETNEDVTEAKAQEIMDGIRGLKGKIPGVLDVQIGENFTDRAPHISHAAVIMLADKDTLANYGPHEAHQDLLKILLPAANSLTIADIEV